MDGEQTTPRGEWSKFIVLTLVLLGVVVVVALIRPFVFGRVVPAILGEGGTDTAVVDPAPTDTDTTTPVDSSTDEPVDEPAADSDQGSAETETDEAEEADNNTEAEADETTTEADEMDPETLPTSVPTIEHTVSYGETLTAIARRYEVTADMIIQANQLLNPNMLRVGDVLLIPEK